MSTRANTAALLTSAGVLALGWAAGAAHHTAQAATTSTADPTATSAGSAAPSLGPTTSSGTTSSGTTSSALKNGTFTGHQVQYQYGQIAVTVTITNGRISSVSENLVPDGERRSEMINAQAVPTLRAEVVQADSAQVSTVSGATYTSQAYLQSLQSALDQAKE